MCDADGPFDVVVLDMALSQLVLALMQVSLSCLVCDIVSRHAYCLRHDLLRFSSGCEAW